MRITGGLARGRRLLGPKGDQQLLRPTCDRVREALFNILGSRVRHAVVLELFAGTGAWGIEALSRGARAVLFIDEAMASGRLIATNVSSCLNAGVQAGFLRLHLDKKSELAFLSGHIPPPHRFDLVFMDPPYGKNLAADLLPVVEGAHFLAPNALVVAEEHQRILLPRRIGTLRLQDRRRYGASSLWLYTVCQPNGA